MVGSKFESFFFPEYTEHNTIRSMGPKENGIKGVSTRGNLSRRLIQNTAMAYVSHPNYSV